jgi:hypothetical protein
MAFNYLKSEGIRSYSCKHEAAAAAARLDFDHAERGPVSESINLMQSE